MKESMLFHHSLLLEGVAPLISWSKLLFKSIGFLGHFAIFGALGFRFMVLRSHKVQPAEGHVDQVDAFASMYEVAERGAARVGLCGALLLVINYVVAIAWKANAAHISAIAAARRADPEDIAEIVIAPLLLIAFTLALQRMRGAWACAVFAGLALALRHLVTGRWVALVNPLHEFAASLWLGTLF